MKKIIILICLLNNVFLYAQNLNSTSELQKIKEAYEKKVALSCSMKYRLYDKSSGKTVEELNGSMTIKNKDYKFIIAGIQYIFLQGVLLYIDDTNQILMLFSKDKSKGGVKNMTQLMDILSKNGISATAEVYSKDSRKLTIKNSSNNTSSIIWYSPKDYLVGQIQSDFTELGQDQILEVTYENYTKGTSDIPNSFNSYISSTDKDFRPVGKYKDYEVQFVE